MSDLIDRQAAIDELHMHLMYRMATESNKQRLDAWINNLPSVQSEIIHCRDCIHIDPVSVRSGSLYCTKIKRYMTENDFCSLAERRTDG